MAEAFAAFAALTLRTVTPGLVFASDARYAKAIAATVSSDMDIVMNEGGVDGKQLGFQLCYSRGFTSGLVVVLSGVNGQIEQPSAPWALRHLQLPVARA